MKLNSSLPPDTGVVIEYCPFPSVVVRVNVPLRLTLTPGSADPSEADDTVPVIVREFLAAIEIIIRSATTGIHNLFFMGFRMLFEPGCRSPVASIITYDLSATFLYYWLVACF